MPVRVESLCAVRETTTTSLRDRPADKVSGKRMACDTRSARGPMSPSQRTVRGALPIRLRLCLAPDGLARNSTNVPMTISAAPSHPSAALNGLMDAGSNRRYNQTAVVRIVCRPRRVSWQIVRMRR